MLSKVKLPLFLTSFNLRVLVITVDNRRWAQDQIRRLETPCNGRISAFMLVPLIHVSTLSHCLCTTHIALIELGLHHDRRCRFGDAEL